MILRKNDFIKVCAKQALNNKEIENQGNPIVSKYNFSFTLFSKVQYFWLYFLVNNILVISKYREGHK